MHSARILVALLVACPAAADWQTELDTPYHDHFSALAETPEGGLVVAGGSTVLRTPVPGRWAWLATLDGAGGLIDASLITDDAFQVYEVEMSDGGGLALVAQDFYSVYPATPPPSRVFVLRVLPDGTLAWSRTISSPTESLSATWAVELDGGDVLVHGLTGGSPQKTWLVRLDPAGQPRWQSLLDPGAGWYAPTRVAVSGARLLVAGWTSLAPGAAWLGSIDLADGRLQAQVTFPFPQAAYPVGVLGDGSGGGWMTSTGFWTGDAWVARFDASLAIGLQVLLGGDSTEWLAPQAVLGGDVLLAGRTQSWDDVDQTWLVRLRPDGSVAWQRAGFVGAGFRVLDDGTWLLSGSLPGMPAHGFLAMVDEDGSVGTVLRRPARARRAIHGRRFPTGNWALVDDSVDSPLGDGGASTLTHRTALGSGGDCVFEPAGVSFRTTDAVPVPTSMATAPGVATVTPVTFAIADAPPLTPWPIAAEPGCPCVLPAPVAATMRTTGAWLRLEPAAGVTHWNVYEGTLDDFGSGAATCHVAGSADGGAVVVPHAASAGTWFLATASNACGESGAGSDSFGAPRGLWLCGASP